MVPGCAITGLTSAASITSSVNACSVKRPVALVALNLHAVGRFNQLVAERFAFGIDGHNVVGIVGNKTPFDTKFIPVRYAIIGVGQDN